MVEFIGTIRVMTMVPKRFLALLLACLISVLWAFPAYADYRADDIPGEPSDFARREAQVCLEVQRGTSDEYIKDMVERHGMKLLSIETWNNPETPIAVLALVTNARPVSEVIDTLADEECVLYAGMHPLRGYTWDESSWHKMLKVPGKDYLEAYISGVRGKYYTGSPVAQEVIEVKVGDVVLTEGVDYEVTYDNNVDIGRNAARIIVTGKGAYDGSAYSSFNIYGHWRRIWGHTAQETMRCVIGRAFPSQLDDSCERLIVATQDGYYDALAASGLAGVLDCPIMTVTGGALSEDNKSLLEQLLPSEIYVVGGTVSAPDSIVTAIKGMIPDAPMIRVAGSNAIATAEAIYDEGKAAAGWGDTAIVTTLDAYQDALSASPFAFAKKAPIFLVTGTGGTLPESSLSKIKAGGFKRVLIVGGTTSVGAVEDQLAGIECIRKSGDNCYATSKELANWCWSEGMTGSEPAVATGTSYYDALVGGPVCGKNNSVLVVADDGHLDAVNGFIAAHKDVFPESGYLLGGEASVPNEVDMAVNLALI